MSVEHCLGLIFGVQFGELVGQITDMSSGLVVGAVGEQFAPEKHPPITEGVADDESTMCQPEEHGDAAAPVVLDDFRPAGQHRLAAPRRELTLAIAKTGADHTAPDGRGT